MSPKKIIIVGFLIITSGVWWLLKAGQEITNYPSSNDGIVAFGDSLIEGVGASRPGGFVSVLSDKIGQPIFNLGVSGNTTADGLKRIDEVLNLKPKVVLLLLGGNDFLRRVPEVETFQNLEEMIEKIHASGSIVVLLGIQGGVITDNFDDNFELLVEKHQTAYIPNILDDLIGNPRLMADTIHPNDAGYVIIADRVHAVLVKVLE